MAGRAMVRALKGDQALCNVARGAGDHLWSALGAVAGSGDGRRRGRRASSCVMRGIAVQVRKSRTQAVREHHVCSSPFA
jgi:hypothetical protein